MIGSIAIIPQQYLKKVVEVEGELASLQNWLIMQKVMMTHWRVAKIEVKLRAMEFHSKEVDQIVSTLLKELYATH